ncbi:sensor domain-containing diguanylate cyclase [Pseudoalteromonas gelatinilytica]
MRGFWLWNVQTGETIFNDKWADIIGYTLQELLPVSIETWLRFAHPDDLSKSEQLLNAHFKGDSKRYICEARMKHKQGHWVKVLDKGQVQSWDENGNPEWMLGVHIDITEQWLKEREIEFLHAKLQKFTDNLPGFVYQYVVEKDGTAYFPFASSKVFNIYGCTADDIKDSADLIMQTIHPDDLERVVKSIEKSRVELCDWHEVYRVNHPTKGVIWVEGKSSPIARANGSVEWNGYSEDVTEEVKSNEKIQLLTAVFSTTSRGILITTPEPKIVDVNSAFEKITGFNKAEVLDKNPSILSAKQQPTEFFELMWERLLNTGRWQGEIWNKRKTGEVFPELLTIDAMYDEHGQVSHYIGAFDDISQAVEKRQLLDELVNQDPLTKLLNRRGLDIQLHSFSHHAANEGNQFSLIYVDLDNFKLVNDTFGHEQGDNLLLEISEQLSLQLRDKDILARIGGDEFVIVLPTLAKLSVCQDIAGRCQKAVEGVAKRYATKVPVSASFGIALYPEDGKNAKELLATADEQMYKMKLKHKASPLG